MGINRCVNRTFAWDGIDQFVVTQSDEGQRVAHVALRLAELNGLIESMPSSACVSIDR